MPQNPCIIATKTPTADVLVFDYTKHPSKPGELHGLYFINIHVYMYINFCLSYFIITTTHSFACFFKKLLLTGSYLYFPNVLSFVCVRS